MNELTKASINTQPNEQVKTAVMSCKSPHATVRGPLNEPLNEPLTLNENTSLLQLSSYSMTKNPRLDAQIIPWEVDASYVQKTWTT